MKALILAAGLGTRLRPITNKIPKVMVDVGGKPVIKHLIAHLNKYGIDEIIINLHYLPLEVMKHVGDQAIYSYEPTLLGEYGTIVSLKDWYKGEKLIVMNGDTLTDIDLSRLIQNCEDTECSIASYDSGIYTGTRIIHPANNKIIPVNYLCWWQDMGTPEGLEKARKHFK